MTLTIPEVLDKLKLAKTKSDRVLILQQNDSQALRGILRMNYDKSLNLSLPPGVPPYKKSDRPVGFGDTTLLASAKSWYVFVKEASPNLAQSKREYLFITLLEQLDPKESEILLLAKDRKLDLGLSKKVINDAFQPGLIMGDLAKNEVSEENVSEELDEAAKENFESQGSTNEPKKRGRGRPKKKK